MLGVTSSNHESQMMVVSTIFAVDNALPLEEFYNIIVIDKIAQQPNWARHYHFKPKTTSI